MSFQFLKCQLMCSFFSSQMTLHAEIQIVHVNWRVVFSSQMTLHVEIQIVHVNWHAIFFLHKWHYMLKSKLCISIDVQFFSSQMTLHVKIQIVYVNWYAVFFFINDTTCRNPNRTCQLTCSLFLCKFLRGKCQKLATTLLPVTQFPWTWASNPSMRWMHTK